MTRWGPGWPTVASFLFIIAGVAMIGAGFRPDQPPRPFLNLPYSGTTLYIWVIIGASVSTILEMIRMFRADFKENKGDQ